MWVAQPMWLPQRDQRASKGWPTSQACTPCLKLTGSLGSLITPRTSTQMPCTWIARTIAPLAELIALLLGAAPLFTKYSLRVLAEPGRFSSTRARRELGYAPRPLQDTIRDTLDWATPHPAE